MSKISSLLSMGRRSLMNNQNALQTVSHNIANKSTEGYSRQRVEFQTSEPVGLGKKRFGTGANTSAVRRINNPFVEKQINQETEKMGFANSQSDGMARVEQIFNEQVNKGLNRFVTEFFNSMRELANNPESLAARTLVKEKADFLTRDFLRVNEQLKSIQGEMDVKLRNEVQEINAITDQIATLNKDIQTVELAGGIANDERDRRDLLVKQLNEKIKVKVAEGKDGQITVTAGNTVGLVSGFEASRLEVAPTPKRDGKKEGNLDVFLIRSSEATPVMVTDQLEGGTIGGALDIRDREVNYIVGQLDKLAYQLSRDVNAFHSKGFNRFDRTNINFFENISELDGASENLKLSKEVKADASNIATAMDQSAPGDNRILLRISGLQYDKAMDGGRSTYDDFYNGLVGEIAVTTRKTNSMSEHQTNVVDQLKNVREAISGVSLDEEAVKMIEFQKNYDASARMIRVADEMLKTVLDLV